MRTGLLARLGERGGEPLDLCLATLERGHEMPAGCWQYRQADLCVADVPVARAARRGCRHLGLETSRRLLDDGAFVFKRSWGAGLRRDERPPSRVSVRFRNRAPEFVAPFLARHPFVATTPDGLTAVVGAPGLEEASRAEQRLRDRSYSPGLRALRIVTGRPEDARTIRY
jgi:hypothetical protein